MMYNYNFIFALDLLGMISIPSSNESSNSDLQVFLLILHDQNELIGNQMEIILDMGNHGKYVDNRNRNRS